MPILGDRLFGVEYYLVFCATLYRRGRFIETRSERSVLFREKKKPKKWKAGQAYKNRKDQANKTGKRRPSLKMKRMVRFTRAKLNYIYISMYVYKSKVLI